MRVVEEGNIEMIKYVDRLNTMPKWEWEKIYRLAKEKKHVEILEWIISEKKLNSEYLVLNIVSTVKALRHLQRKA